MTPGELAQKKAETIDRFGGTQEAKKVPKQATLDTSGKKIPPHHETLPYLLE